MASTELDDNLEKNVAKSFEQSVRKDKEAGTSSKILEEKIHENDTEKLVVPEPDKDPLATSPENLAEDSLDESNEQQNEVMTKKNLEATTQHNNGENYPENGESSKTLETPNSPSSSSSTSKNNDATFEPTVDMMVNDFDDEATLEEEETLAAQESEDASAELNSLEKERDMPIEELLALYNCSPPTILVASTTGRRGIKRGGKRRRIASSVVSPPKKEKRPLLDETVKSDEKELNKIVTEVTNKERDEDEMEDEIDEEDEEEIDGTTLIDDEEDEDDDSKEISDLRKLYPETYGDKGDKCLLRTLSRQQSDEEDNDYSPDEEDIKKTIMIGNAFQAVIPEGFSQYDDVLPYENEDKLLWDPSRLSEKQTEEYLLKAEEQGKTIKDQNGISIDNLPCGKHLRDDEQALFLLLQCGHNVDEALRRKRINPVPSIDQMSVWSEEECRNFESVIRLHGKDFHTIKHAKVHTRSVGELVQFYYLWKKTERHDVFANKGRLEKKKYNLNPGLTDYMDRFLEELDSSNTNPNNSGFGDRSSSPSAAATITANSEEGTGTNSNS